MTVHTEGRHPMTVAVTDASGFIRGADLGIARLPYRARVLSRRRTDARDGRVAELDEEAAVKAGH